MISLKLISCKSLASSIFIRQLAEFMLFFRRTKEWQSALLHPTALVCGLLSSSNANQGLEYISFYMDIYVQIPTPSVFGVCQLCPIRPK